MSLYTTTMGEGKDETRRQSCIYTTDRYSLRSLESILGKNTEDGGSTHDGEVSSGKDGSTILVIVATAATSRSAGARRTVGSGGVLGLRLTLVLSVDGVVLPVVELLTAEVTTALHVETTLDALEGRKSSPVKEMLALN